MSEEIKQESVPEQKPGPEQKPDNGRTKEFLAPTTDFKIAEIWIKNGQLFVEAPRVFWEDRVRAAGILSYCMDIVKEAKIPEEKSKIIQPKGAVMNFIRNGFRKKK